MLVDARLFAGGLRDGDLETLLDFGVRRCVVAPLLRPRARDEHAWLEAFDALFEREIPRLQKFGFDARAMVGVHGRSMPEERWRLVVGRLPRYLGHRACVALGSLGLHKGTRAELELLREQLALAADLHRPVVVTAFGRTGLPASRRLLLELRKHGPTPARVLVDGLARTLVPSALAMGFHVGLTVHPDVLTAEDATATIRSLGPTRLLVETAAGRGASNLLGLARTEHLLEKSGLPRAVVDRTCGDTAARFFGISD